MSSITLSRQSVVLDETEAPKRFGLIALSTDLTSERDLIGVLPRDKTHLHVTRVAHDNPTTPENLRKMTPRLTGAAELLVPGQALEAICYSCTSASVVIGDEEIARAIGAARPGVPVVTPTGAARQAFDMLGIRRIAVLAPYLVETSEPMAAYFTDHGFDVVRFECFGMADDRVIATISEQTIVEGAVLCDDPLADGLFVSCTALPALGVIDEIEARIGKPVVTSNQASAWAMMRHAGLDDGIDGYGRLFREEMGPQRRISSVNE